MPELNLEDGKDVVASGESGRLSGGGKSTPKAQRHETNSMLGVVRYCCCLECNWWGPHVERGEWLQIRLTDGQVHNMEDLISHLQEFGTDFAFAEALLTCTISGI